VGEESTKKSEKAQVSQSVSSEVSSGRTCPEQRYTSPNATFVSTLERPVAEKCTASVSPVEAGCGGRLSAQAPLPSTVAVEEEAGASRSVAVTVSPTTAPRPHSAARCGARCSTMLEPRKVGSSGKAPHGPPVQVTFSTSGSSSWTLRSLQSKASSRRVAAAALLLPYAGMGIESPAAMWRVSSWCVVRALSVADVPGDRDREPRSVDGDGRGVVGAVGVVGEVDEVRRAVERGAGAGGAAGGGAHYAHGEVGARLAVACVAVARVVAVGERQARERGAGRERHGDGGGAVLARAAGAEGGEGRRLDDRTAAQDQVARGGHDERSGVLGQQRHVSRISEGLPGGPACEK